MTQELKQALATVTKFIDTICPEDRSVYAALSTVEEALGKLENDLLDSVTQEQHQAALTWGTTERDKWRGKYHVMRREVRRLSACMARVALCQRLGKLPAGTSREVKIHELERENERLHRELSAVDSALGIPPNREPRRLELLASLRAAPARLFNAATYAVLEPPAPPVECSCSCHPMLGVGLCMLCCRTEPHTGKPVEAPPAERAIVVGSLWRTVNDELRVTHVTESSVDYVYTGPRIFGGGTYARHLFASDFTHVSDPAPPSPPEPTPDSPPFEPKELAEFAGRGFERVNRGAVEVEPVARAEPEPEPRCRCEHPRSDHDGKRLTGCCRNCACMVYEPQAERWKL